VPKGGSFFASCLRYCETVKRGEEYDLKDEEGKKGGRFWKRRKCDTINRRGG
jgi:hypothetical protein